MSIFTLIDSLAAPSSGVFDFPSLTLTGYKAIEIDIAGVTVTTDDTEVMLQFYVGGVLITTGYRFSTLLLGSGAAAAGDGATSGSGIKLQSNDANLGVGNDTGERFNSSIQVDEPLNTTRHKRALYESLITLPSGVRHSVQGQGIMENTGAVSGLKISGDSDLLAGHVRVYGVA